MKQTLLVLNRAARRLLILGAMLLSSSSFGQQLIQGTVQTRSGAPISGVTVYVMRTEAVSSTDIDGNFVVQASVGDSIRFTAVSYQPKNVVVSSSGRMLVLLDEAEFSTGEVVVVGYGQVRKGDVTGALTTVKVDEGNRGFAPNAQDILTGKVAGVTITNEGGSPSGGAAIRIRGGSSLTASNDPLIVIDGVFIDNQGLGGVGNLLSTINPTDIESFTVLKDASATAIYGSRASNGVILITTKKGGKGRPQFTYDGNTSVSTLNSQIDVLSAAAFKTLLQERFGELDLYEEITTKLGDANTNWQDVIFRTGLNTEHNISLLGSMKQVLPYRLSVGYHNLNGTLKTSHMERWTGSFALNPTFYNNHLKVNLNGRGMAIRNRFADQNAIGAALVMDPTQAVYDENSPFGGYFTWIGQDGQIIQVATKNPLSLLDMTTDRSKAYNFIGNAQLDYKLHFLPDVNVNLNLGLDQSSSEGLKYISEFSPSDYVYGGYDSIWDQKRRNSTLDLYAQYNKDFDFLDSHFDVMGGYSWQHYWRKGGNIGHRIARYDAYGDPELVSSNLYETEHYIVSFFGRMNYQALGKYLLTFTLRQDGSSRFHRDNRWSVFPSAAFAWRISEETFMKQASGINELKLRLGWGMTGQQDINQGDYPYLATYMHSIGEQASYLRGYHNGTPLWSSLLRPEAFNPNLKWETTTTYNLGLDYAFLNRRIEGAIELYHRETKDLINAETRTLAGTNFREYVAANIGNLQNTGVEFALNTKPVVKEGLSWDLGANVAYNKNEITKLVAGDDPNAMRRVGMNVHMVGQRANMYYVYEQVYDEAGNPIEGLYRDLNNDGQINEEDLRPYHNPMPEWTLGFHTKMTWKDWDLSVAGHGSLGNYNYNAVAANNAGLSVTSVYANEFLSNRVGSALSTNFQTGHPLSDYYVQDASFFRIDNIVLGWSFKSSPRFPLQGRIYGAVQNPMVFTRYDGLDPEVFGGYDGNVYPRPTTALLGVNLKF